MLIDDLLSADVISNLDAEGARRFKRRLREAIKFELAADFSAAAEGLADNFTNLAKAIPFCKVPFKSCWFEVAQMHRPRFNAAGIHLPGIQSRPKRVGFLVDTLDDTMSSFRAHQFWSFPEKTRPPNISEIAMGFHPDKMDEDIKWARDNNPRKVGKFQIEVNPSWLKADPISKARLGSIIHPESPDFITSWFHAFQDGRPELAKTAYEINITDWSGEAVFLLAVIGMLNARNFHERAKVDVSKLNKRRSKYGEELLQEYYVLKVQSRIKERIRSVNIAAQEFKDLRHHIVIGHWKMRKTGIFYWHPHWRGDPRLGEVRKGYKLEV
jgi:hypothetical protein